MKNGLVHPDVTQTILSKIDGQQGELILRGHRLEDIAGKNSYEALATLLWQGLSPGTETETNVEVELGRARYFSFMALSALWPSLKEQPVLEALRLGLSALSPTKTNISSHYLVTGGIAVILANILRIRRGLQPIEPDPELPQVQDFLRMVHGARTNPEQEWGLSTYLTTVAEHGLNASTFTARVIASTQSDLLSAVLGALGALKGPLHGGAPGPVLDMLDAIGTEANIQPWIQAELSAGHRLMGFGHRIYQVRDPRADVLKTAVARLRQSGQGRLALAEQVESVALALLHQHKPQRRLETNVEFYTALLLEALGFEREAFTAIFALGRVLGWIAHYYEQQQTGRLIRPESAYVGPIPVAATV